MSAFIMKVDSAALAVRPLWRTGISQLAEQFCLRLLELARRQHSVIAKLYELRELVRDALRCRRWRVLRDVPAKRRVLPYPSLDRPDFERLGTPLPAPKDG
jgi:hypothetical protein